MKIDVTRKLPERMDCIIVLQKPGAKVSEIGYLPKTIAESIESYVCTEEYDWAYGSLKNFHHQCAGHNSKIILLGTGEDTELNANMLRNLMATGFRQAKKIKASQVFLFIGYNLPVGDVMLGHLVAEAALLSSYKFNRYLSDPDDHRIESIHLALNDPNTRQINRGILEGRIYAEATLLARDLVNEPANVLTPEALAEAAKKAALHYGFNIDVISYDKLKRIKMDAFLAVARGSKHEPKLIIMRYNGLSEKKQEIVGLIGKGLTYDSGGYCIKTPQGMVNMKNDMGGSAAVIGAMSAIAALKLKVNVVAIVAACENMISGDAYRAGDIIRSLSGKTIEVINTDAEGRLTLADAIHYALDREKVNRILDIATLTGAAVGALGNQITAVMTNDPAWLAKLQDAANFSGELIWQMPTHDEYKEMIKSEIADLKNVGGPMAGCITAGLFLKEFVQSKPWIHMDIAGTALKEKESGLYSYGATGVGVRTLVTLIKSME